MTATIRAARRGDEDALAKLNAFVQDLHVERRPDQFKPADTSEVARWFGSLLEDPAARIWIAEQEGEPVGYVVALLRERSENPFCRARRWCELDQVAVASNKRKQGIARGLIEHAVVDVQSDGIRDVEVSSWSFNEEAHRAFQRLGFVPKVVRFELAHLQSRG